MNLGVRARRPEGPLANRAALRTIMDYWLGLGVSGFRVDMASSLVKDDPGFAETARLWREVRAWLDRAHPDAVLLSEWGDPAVAVPAGFNADFFLHFGGPTMAGRCFRFGATASPPGLRDGRQRRATSAPTVRGTPARS